MSLNSAVSAERTHIGFFGCRNAGKSSLVNAVTGQSLSVVSEIEGTTTDPVKKAMELLPLGPVVMIDTPGYDDQGPLGELRVQKTLEILRSIDIAVLVVDAAKGIGKEDHVLTELFEKRHIPYLIAYNKADLLDSEGRAKEHEIYCSAVSDYHIRELKETLAHMKPEGAGKRHLISDLISPGDTVVLVVPIDSAAPKGRLILPQQQTLRDVLEAGCSAMVTRESELSRTMARLKDPPRLVVTDSQAFHKVVSVLPEDQPLTSFSILFARYKGHLEEAVKGADALSRLRDGDTVLISEGCSHHRQCEDIGTVKLPAWIRAYTHKALRFAFTSGGEFPQDLSPYAVVVHCGGCMLNGREMAYRVQTARESGVPITNYGIAIAQMNGILRRALRPFGDTTTPTEQEAME